MPSGSERALALTMPAVTELSKPYGEPMATTHSPTRIGVGIADLDHGQVGRVDLDHRDVGLRIGANDLRREFALVGEPDENLVSGAHHVGVGEDQAVGADDEAGAQARGGRASPRGDGIWKRRKNSGKRLVRIELARLRHGGRGCMA